MDFSKPQLIVAITWCLAFGLSALIETNLSVAFPVAIYVLAFGGVAAFYLSAAAARLLLPIAPGTPRFPAPSDLDLDILSLFVRRVFVVWAIGFLGSIVYSEGIPIYWKLIGDSRNYLDFGMPTVSGLVNMLRCFCIASCVMLHLQKRAKRQDYIILAVTFFSSIAEISRGSVTSAVLHGAAVIVLLRPVYPMQIAKWGGAVWVALLSFEWVGNNRTEGYQGNFGEVLGGAFQDNGTFLSHFVWSFIYITSPFNNLAFAVSQNIEPPMVPYYTLQPLIPTFLRNMLFGQTEYPIELLNEAFNATTFYSPLVADFGPWFALAIFALITVVISFAYQSAKRGSLFGIMVYPPIFVSVTLSFFYSYFFALPIVAYPLVVWIFLRFRRRTLRKMGYR